MTWEWECGPAFARPESPLFARLIDVGGASSSARGWMAGREQAADLPSTCTSSLSRCSGPVGEAELEINIPIQEEGLEICLPIEEEELEICLPIEEEELEICLPIEEKKLEILLPIKGEELEICLPIQEDEELDTCLQNQQEHNILPAKSRVSCVKEMLKRTE